jgi:hypothetical protein
MSADTSLSRDVAVVVWLAVMLVLGFAAVKAESHRRTAADGLPATTVTQLVGPPVEDSYICSFAGALAQGEAVVIRWNCEATR